MDLKLLSMKIFNFFELRISIKLLSSESDFKYIEFVTLEKFVTQQSKVKSW